MKLLIVEDNAAVRRLIAEIVRPYFGEIRECANGGDAVAAYQAQMPNLVLMDIRMEGMDGIEATRRIKAVDPTAKIVIVTDYDDSILRRAAMDAGACHYALKDNLADLFQFLEKNEIRALPETGK